ncbi:hypothetical protein SCH01S_45_00210 [Sphingomonas changbaiensis NBRC 104936]|uniref:Lipoprotein n=1 Tax=Sphingomonas changbaiensis NBRC 104936 TaxID=1219043 RepID=A0A0E9MRR5_9SPHN|nr:hypothetical protein [Sphingomonas changbaiensis]GAO40178.1 hypothetical protein SCH01S_45_00210 [Sphingomonas changbaiensis NBRC 104936]
MRRLSFVAAVLAVVLSSCNKSGGDAASLFTGIGQKSVGQLLRDGDAKACADAAVQSQLREAIQAPFEANQSMSAEEIRAAVSQAPQVKFTDFQATEVKKSIGEAHCEVNAAVADSSVTVPFVLRQSLEDNSAFLLNGDFDQAILMWRNVAFASLARLTEQRNLQRAQAEGSEAAARRQAEEEQWAAKDPARWACWQRVKDSNDQNEKNACLTKTVQSASPYDYPGADRPPQDAPNPSLLPANATQPR